jgi:hypothetical protein
MTSTTTLIARPFTFDGHTFFITPKVHNSLLRLWRLENLVAHTPYQHYSTTHELHTLGREVAEACGLTRSEWPADWMLGGIHNPEPARERTRLTVLALARTYSEATGHVIYKSTCYSGCVAHWHCIAHAPDTCRFLNVPCRCFLTHLPQ